MYQVVALVLTLGLVVLLALGVPVGMALAIAGCLGFLANAGEIMAWFHSTVHSCSEDHEWFFCHKENL